MEKISKIKEKMEKQLQNAGKFEIDGITFETFDIRLLDTNSGTLEEHINATGAGTGYFGYLVERAKKYKEESLRMYDKWYAKIYIKAKEELELKGHRNPTNLLLESYIINTYPKKYYHYKNLVKKYTEIEAILLLWYKSWSKKCFGLKDLKDLKEEAIYAKLMRNKRMASDFVKGKIRSGRIKRIQGDIEEEM